MSKWTKADAVKLRRLEIALDEESRSKEVWYGLAEEIDALRIQRSIYERDHGLEVTGGPEPKPYRGEVRFDVTAYSDEDALAQVARIAGRVDGEVTAVFDEEWEEVQ